MHFTAIDIEPGRPFILRGHYLTFLCPGCKVQRSVKVYRAKRTDPHAPTWVITGTERNPTLHPSLVCDCGFHSFLENGIFREV